MMVWHLGTIVVVAHRCKRRENKNDRKKCNNNNTTREWLKCIYKESHASEHCHLVWQPQPHINNIYYKYIPWNPLFFLHLQLSEVSTLHRQGIVWKSVNIPGNEFECRNNKFLKAWVSLKINLDAFTIHKFIVILRFIRVKETIK